MSIKLVPLPFSVSLYALLTCLRLSFLWFWVVLVLLAPRYPAEARVKPRTQAASGNSNDEVGVESKV
jgi:hypothetical protein